MKKILFSLTLALFCVNANAQNPFIEKWPNGNTKTEGFVIGTVGATAGESKESQARAASSIVKDGKWITYYENATLRSEEHYNNGKMVGNWKVFYENGVLESDINFVAGTASYYHKNGKKHSEGGMLSGMIHTGTWTCYYENGTRNYVGSYDANGNKIGTWKWFDEKGNPVSEQVFDNGNLISTKTLTK